jgi:Carboxypeptidase regulatory-like domain
MNRKLKLLSIGSLVLTLLSFSDTAFACDCMGTRPTCEAYWQAEAVFIGTAKEISWIELEDKIENSTFKYRKPVFHFSVDQAFRGVNGSQVGVMTGQGGGDCGYGFKIGEQYLIYAYRDNQKKEMLSTSICTRTRPIRNADEDLEYIQGLSKASPGGWVFGEVFKSNRGPEGLLPLEGVKITVEGQGKSVTVTTDSDGKFRASSLPEGNYKIRVAPPEGLSAGSNESEVKVADRGCATVTFWLVVDGRVYGRVLDAEGKPLPNCYVMLYSAEAANRYSGFSMSATTDDQGRYKIGQVPPGHYKLTINYDGPRDESRSEFLKSFPLFYYPGVLSADQAGVIVVGESAKVEDVDFKLPTPPERTIEGVVLWPDGKPASNVPLTCYLHGGRIRAPIKIDERGHFSFKTYEGLELYLVAQIEIEKGKWMRSETKVDERGDLVGVKLILAPRKDN